MGLDMYLQGRRKEVNDTADLVVKKLKGEDEEVWTEIGYWRKANAIHSWFVKNVQGGVDDCQNYPVTHKQLRALLDDVNKVLGNMELCTELLPTQDGFFFGNTSYGNCYEQDLETTRTILTNTLTDEYIDWEYQYRASW